MSILKKFVLTLIQLWNMLKLRETLKLLNTVNSSLLYGLYMVAKIYILLVELRFLIAYLLFINPYYQPFLTLWMWTTPVFNGGRKYYPKIIAVDLCPLVNYAILKILVKILYRICIRYTQALQAQSPSEILGGAITEYFMEDRSLKPEADPFDSITYTPIAPTYNSKALPDYVYKRMRGEEY